MRKWRSDAARLAKCFRAVACILAGAAAGWGTPARAEGIPMGKWIFYPSVDTLWQSEDNLFLQHEDPESASSLTLRPNLRWELPFRQSSFKLGYSPQVREFVSRGSKAETGLEKRYYSHYANVESRLVFSNGLKMRFKDSLVFDTLETLNFDPGGEVPFNSTPYRRNTADFETIKGIGARNGAGLQARYEEFDFEEEEEQSFIEYERADLGLLYLYHLSPATQFKAAYLIGTGTQNRGSLSVSGEVEKFNSQQLLASLQGALGRRTLLEASLGYLSWDFRSPDVQDFNGVSGEVRWKLLLSERTSLSAEFASQPFQSFFNVNSYYVGRSVDLRFAHEPGSHFLYSLAAGYRQNDYPGRVVSSDPQIDGVRRKDRIWRGEAGIGYKFSEALRAELRYRHDDRGSNLEILEYDSNRLTLRLFFGMF